MVTPDAPMHVAGILHWPDKDQLPSIASLVRAWYVNTRARGARTRRPREFEEACYPIQVPLFPSGLKQGSFLEMVRVGVGWPNGGANFNVFANTIKEAQL